MPQVLLSNRSRVHITYTQYKTEHDRNLANSMVVDSLMDEPHNRNACR